MSKFRLGNRSIRGHDLNLLENLRVDLKRGVHVLRQKTKTSSLVSYFFNKIQFLKSCHYFAQLTVLRQLDTIQNRNAARTILTAPRARSLPYGRIVAGHFTGGQSRTIHC